MAHSERSFVTAKYIGTQNVEKNNGKEPSSVVPSNKTKRGELTLRDREKLEALRKSLDKKYRLSTLSLDWLVENIAKITSLAAYKTGISDVFGSGKVDSKNVTSKLEQVMSSIERLSTLAVPLELALSFGVETAVVPLGKVADIYKEQEKALNESGSDEVLLSREQWLSAFDHNLIESTLKDLRSSFDQVDSEIDAFGLSLTKKLDQKDRDVVGTFLVSENIAALESFLGAKKIRLPRERLLNLFQKRKMLRDAKLALVPLEALQREYIALKKSGASIQKSHAA